MRVLVKSKSQFLDSNLQILSLINTNLLSLKLRNYKFLMALEIVVLEAIAVEEKQSVAHFYAEAVVKVAAHQSETKYEI